MKKTLALVLAILMAFALFGCTTTDPVETTAPSDSGAVDTSTPTAETLEFVYLCSSLTIQWCQDIVDTISEFEGDLNFNLTAGDSNNDNEVMVNLVETYCDQGVDGFFLNAREDINQRLFEITQEAGIPVLFESTRIYDATSKALLTSGVELNAYDCGKGCSDWVIANYADYGFDFSDESVVGFIGITHSAVQSFVNRTLGATETFAAAYPDANVFTADLVAQGDFSAESAYAEVAAIISANPAIEQWIVCGVLDDWALGATRAIEEAGIEEKSMVVSVGGEALVIEWDGGYEGCWVMCNYFNSMDFSKLLGPAMVAVARGETTIPELFPEWKVDDGSGFSSVLILGEPAIKSTYEAIREAHSSKD